MTHIYGLLSPARALHRVLLLRLANTTNTSNAVSSSLPRLGHARTPGNAISSALYCRVRAFSGTSRARASHPTNYDIPYKFVRISDSGVLSRPKRLESVIESLPAGYEVRMVAPPPPRPEVSELGGITLLEPSAPVCLIVDAVAIAAKMAEIEKEAKEESKRAKKFTKTLELNWGTAPHDLEHKMKRLTEFLQKGMRVDVMMARKKRTQLATPEKCEELVQKVREAVDKIPGTTEYKKMEGRVGGVLMMAFAGPSLKKRSKEDSVEEGKLAEVKSSEEESSEEESSVVKSSEEESSEEESSEVKSSEEESSENSSEEESSEENSSEENSSEENSSQENSSQENSSQENSS
ncbi:hypothetical protein GGS21DRAFT_117492 [Xylaria nigripes]|nr:hypothetical protein GGS21DRAFT_117492 [Xylaria nigripes]